MTRPSVGRFCRKIEGRVLDEEERIMPALKISLDEAEEKGVRKGLRKGN